MFLFHRVLSQQEIIIFCHVPEVKVKIGYRFLLSLQGYVSISHDSSSTASIRWPRTSAGPTALHDVSYNDVLDITQFLVDVVAQVQSWSTLLHSPSPNVRLYLAQFLVEHGANVAVQGQGGWIPLYLVSLYRPLDLARILVHHDANVAAQDVDGLTPLHLASSSGYLDLAHFLTEHDSNATSQAI